MEKITESVLRFEAWDKPWEFEAYVTQSKLNAEDLLLFKEIWQEATKFENWNHKDLNLGAAKTVEILMQNFGLEKSVAAKITNAASYQWK